MLKPWSLLLALLISTRLFCQETDLSEIITNKAEDLAASESDQEAASVYTDRLYDLAENPVNINSASEEEISRLFFLSDFQVKALIDYSRSTGKIVSFNELSLIPGFDRSTAEMIIPFCRIMNNEIKTDDSARIHNALITNFSVRSGKQDTAFLGSAHRVLSKYKFSAGSLSGGFTLEKDPGETFLCPGTINPDFLSAHISYTGKGLLHKIIIGDYAARFGQGFNINTSPGIGLSLTSQGYMSVSGEIKPYTSTDENAFFRGICTMFCVKKMELTLLCSKNDIDATLGNTSGYAEDYIKSFYKAGTHNTSNLLLKKDAVSESFYAMNLSYNLRNSRVGITYSRNIFSLPVKSDESDPEKIFSFNGRSGSILSFHYNAMIKRILLYGELSANDFKKYAFIQGLSLRPSDRLTVNFMFWRFNRGYTSFHGKDPGNSSVTWPEQALFGNFTFEAARHLFISGGYIIQDYQWLKYRCSSPSLEVKREIRIKFLPTDKISFDWLYSYRSMMDDNSAANRIPELKKVTSGCLKLTFRFSLSDNIALGIRGDYKFVNPSGSRGVLFLEDLNFRFSSIPLTLWLRYCTFKTDDYDSRIYTWENDLLSSFSIPALYGHGSRTYFMAGWKIGNKAQIRFKYGILSKNNIGENLYDSGEYRLQIKITI